MPFFNIRNYSPMVTNIQWCEVELNIIWLRVNNFNIKQKRAWNISFIICCQHQTTSGKINANKTQQILVTTEVFFCKNWTTTYSITTPSKSFYITFVDIFFLISLTYEKINRIWIWMKSTTYLSIMQDQAKKHN